MLNKLALVVVIILASGSAHARSANPLTAGARQHYGIIKGYVTHGVGVVSPARAR
jgi:hypothetical protein